MASAAHAVEASGVGRWMRESLWAYPGVEIVHIAGLGLLFGSIVIVDLRLLGLGRGVPATRLAALAVPWTLGGFLLALCSGLLMFSAHADDFLGNRIFLLKMSLIFVAGMNALWLHLGPFAHAGAWNLDGVPPARVRAAAALSMALWLCVIACGRLLAYT
ncbi:MAG: DUF6644 family protein [Betaproteobacteria bacterium]